MHQPLERRWTGGLLIYPLGGHHTPLFCEGRKPSPDRESPALLVAGLPETLAEPAGRRHLPVVLVVDDDADLRLALRHGLTCAGFEVHEACDAFAAYAAA